MNKTTILSDKEYQLAFDIMRKTSIHEKHVFKNFRDNIAANINVKKLFLDIGAGPGKITKQISPLFKNTTVIEPNENYYSTYDVLKWDLITSDFLKSSFSSKFDFILCSHVMYNMTNKYMEEFILKINGLLNTNGICLIAIEAPSGDSYKMLKHFNSKYKASDEIKDLLEKNNITFEKKTKPNSFYSSSFSDFFALCKFLVYENVSFDKLSNNLNKEYFDELNEEIKKIALSYKRDSLYKLSQDEDHFIIKKTA